MIDAEGFRLNVGMILMNKEGKLFWAKRLGMDAWQFPQGGINENETAEDALFRELSEEIGLEYSDVKILAETEDWLKYRLPKRFIRTYSKPLCIGQKQKWFLLNLISNEDKISLAHCKNPEFDAWEWVNYWHPLKQVVAFKRDVYKKALKEFHPVLSSLGITIQPLKTYPNKIKREF